MKATCNGKNERFDGDREVKETLAIPVLTELLASRGDTHVMVGFVR